MSSSSGISTTRAGTQPRAHIQVVEILSIPWVSAYFDHSFKRADKILILITLKFVHVMFR
jgi:hypothetical protein